MFFVPSIAFRAENALSSASVLGRKRHFRIADCVHAFFEACPFEPNLFLFLVLLTM